MPTVFLDGSFVEARDARVSAFDSAFQHGVGLFETLTAVRTGPDAAHVLHGPEHLDRLRVSALELGLAKFLHLGPLAEAVERTCRRAAQDMPQEQRFRIRLTLTGGDLNLLSRSGEKAHSPTLLIVAQPATPYPREMFERGELALLADLKLNPLDPTQGHKTPAYWARLRELQRAAASRAGEALVFTITNHLAGGCVSNAFLVKDGVLWTPIARGEESEVAQGDDGPIDMPGASRGAGVLPSPVLPGIVRRWVLDWAIAEGLDTRRRMLTLDDVLAADELFLTNSSWGVLPITRLESHAFSGGVVGPIASRLVDAWAELVERGPA